MQGDINILRNAAENILNQVERLERYGNLGRRAREFATLLEKKEGKEDLITDEYEALLSFLFHVSEELYVTFPRD